jgi:predicted Zn finger-like uncharacterized protein
MAFAVICKSCQARFLLNDDLLRRRVAGRVVTVRCRQCHATIEVDASGVAAEPTASPAAPPAAPEPPTPKATTQLMFKAPRPAPSPPRPVKSSTLMGIGAQRPQGATELVALSPGLLGVETAISPAAPSRHGFPEPPPPPSAVEELNADDWEVEGAPTPPRGGSARDAAPESVDDFAEELPPSIPPVVEEELPSSTGTPSLKALTHHEFVFPPKPRVDEFLANMSASPSGGNAEGAPTIDVSHLDAPTAKAGPSIDLSDFEFPARGAETLPLFEGEQGMAAITAPLLSVASASEPAAPPPAPSASPRPPAVASRSVVSGAAPARPAAGGSLQPVTTDPPLLEAQPESARERKNVMAPSPHRVAPAAAAPPTTPRRSGLAAPLLLALAAAAAFLIWKRNAAHPKSEPVAQATGSAVVPPPVAAALTPPPEPAAAAKAEPAASAASPSEELTFETTPSKSPATATRAPTQPALSREPEAKPEPQPKPAFTPAPAAPPAEATPTPAVPSEPAGPFNREAAASALTAGAAQASACRKEGDPSGVASVVITFAPSGRVTSANIGGPPFAGTPTGGCIAAALRKVRVPAFDGDRVTVSKTVVIQ